MLQLTLCNSNLKGKYFVRIMEKFELQKGNYESFTFTATLNLFVLRGFELERFNCIWCADDNTNTNMFFTTPNDLVHRIELLILRCSWTLFRSAAPSCTSKFASSPESNIGHSK